MMKSSHQDKETILAASDIIKSTKQEKSPPDDENGMFFD